MPSQNQDIKKNRISILKSKKISQILANKTSTGLPKPGFLESSHIPSNTMSNVWGGKNELSFEGHNVYSLSPVVQEGLQLESKRVKRIFQKGSKEKILKPSLTLGLTESMSNAWVLNKIHPHHYSNILGYRKKNVIVNPNITLQGIRRVLHYLKTIIQVTASNKESLSIQTNTAELIIVVESSILSDVSKENAQASAAALISYSLQRLQEFSNLKVTVKTAKETISYLASSSFKNSASSKTTKSVCGVLILNPAKSILGNLADTLFNQTNKKDKKMSAGNAIGSLCAKKGIPLISLCDVSSPISLCTYPIICDTRNLKSIYLVLDLLTYGLNRLSPSST